ncbi:hypothetical protein DFJ74DRAFT_654560 [Hyaloraphidium curvatum]|nr:hypothetical protein DFJ74DRAFT_654560 [Hyaloraphidium curvatum]
MATASPPGPSEPAIPMSELPPPPAAEASSSSPPDYAPPADADPKDYFHAPPDYSLPSYGNGGPAYHDIEPPDEPIPRYSEARAEAGAAGLPAPDASAHLVAGFARSFRSSRMVAVVTAAATMAMCLVGVINSRALRGGSGAGGLWTAVGVSAGGELPDLSEKGLWPGTCERVVPTSTLSVPWTARLARLGRASCRQSFLTTTHPRLRPLRSPPIPSLLHSSLGTRPGAALCPLRCLRGHSGDGRLPGRGAAEPVLLPRRHVGTHWRGRSTKANARPIAGPAASSPSRGSCPGFAAWCTCGACWWSCGQSGACL